jgi:Flp pilus assembly protein TadG
MKSRQIFGTKTFLADRSGNVALIFALAAIPLFIALAAGVDYARAAKVRGELAAIADAAVLTGTTPAMMTQTTATAKAAVQAMFAAQAQLVTGLGYDPTQLTVSVVDTQQTTATQRAVSVSYQAQVHNAFGAFLSQTQTSFTVTASAATSTAPNIDFYMLVDNSPSMELPATTQGVSDMVSQTSCAFACHETNMADTESKGYVGYGKIDSYTYAENNGIALRIDNVRDAVKSVATSAYATMTNNGANYRMAVYGFNYNFSQFQSLIATTSANVATIQGNVSGLIPPLMASNNNLAGNQTYLFPTGASTYKSVALGDSPLPNDDAMTDFTYAMKQINAVMPNPGNGTNVSGDTPQGVLVIITDGVMDASLYSSTSCNVSTTVPYSNTYGSFTRCQAPIDTTMCATIKNRGIRIAVLYTTYQPLTGQSWYDTYVGPYISQVPANLQACASSPELYQEVTTDGDIQTELNYLFQKAVTTAPRLTN